MRIGTLGAARITQEALLKPALEVEGVEVVAVAARNRRRAAAFADEHGIPEVRDSYAQLIADKTIDAIYNPLPNSAHAEWSVRALEAGKHVLCEKPLALNAAEAEAMVATARRAGRILMEAFHWSYHPVADRVRALVGELGHLRSAEAVFLAKLDDENDFRYQFAFGGGATMDLGCYCVHALRTMTGEEPVVRRAAAVEAAPGVDVSMTADLTFGSGAEARMRCSFAGPPEPVWYLVAEGDAGRLRMENFVKPQLGNRLTAELGSGVSVDEELPLRSSYAYQLEAFRDAVHTGTPPKTGGEDAVRTAAVIDAIYLGAGLPLRSGA